MLKSMLKSFFLPLSLTLALSLGAWNVWADTGPDSCTLDPNAKAEALRDIQGFLTRTHASVTSASFILNIPNKNAPTRKELKRLIAKESACCSDLEFQLTEQATALSLTVSGPPDTVAAALRALQ